MRILMFGRGVISTIYGQAFADAGHDVEFYVRPGRAAEYGGVVRTEVIDGRLAPLGKMNRGTFETRLRETVEPQDGFDLVVLSVGHHRLTEAAAYLAPRIGEATVLVFGNVWDELLDAVAPLPADRVVFGFPQAGGGFGVDGVLHGAVLRSVVIGTTGAAPGPREVTVRTAFQEARFVVKAEKDMRGWLLLHFASDAGMFSQALRSGGLVNMIGDRRALGDAFVTSRELLPVLRSRGVDFRRHRAAMLLYRMPRVVGTISAWASALFPIAKVSLAAHNDPNAAEPRAVLADILDSARRLAIATPRLEQSVREAGQTNAGP